MRARHEGLKISRRLNGMKLDQITIPTLFETQQLPILFVECLNRHLKHYIREDGSRQRSIFLDISLQKKYLKHTI